MSKLTRSTFSAMILRRPNIIMEKVNLPIPVDLKLAKLKTIPNGLIVNFALLLVIEPPSSTARIIRKGDSFETITCS